MTNTPSPYTNQHSLPLSKALKIFADHLDDIKDACAENILYNISLIEPIPEKEGLEGELWQGLHKLEVERAIGPRKKIIDRIVARKQHIGNPKALGGMVTDAQIEAAREYPIEELFEGQLFGGGAGKRRACCPFHDERTPSFYIHLKDNRWSCFGQCNEHGDAISFYMKINGVGFKEAVRALNRG